MARNPRKKNAKRAAPMKDLPADAHQVNGGCANNLRPATQALLVPAVQSSREAAK